MELKTLLQQLKSILMIDNIRAYIYEDGYISIIDYEPEIDTEKCHLEASYGLALKLFLDGNKISVIDHNFNLFTKANKDAIKLIVNYIGVEIIDLDDYPKIPKLENQVFQTI